MSRDTLHVRVPTATPSRGGSSSLRITNKERTSSIIFQCRERGEQATLFLETRDGGEFATLRVNLPGSHRSHSAGKTVLGSTKNKTPNKSPSTLKRDRERLINFIKKKRQESWSDNKTSTPLTKIQSLPEPVHSQPGTPAMDNKASDEAVDKEKRADESDEKEHC